jgi:hypothetical protein
MAKRRDVSRYRAHRRRELDSAALYRILAEVESQPQLVEVYRRLAAVEDKHAEFWGDRLRALGAPVSLPRLSWKGRLRCLLAKLFGPQMVLPMLADLEATEQHTYKDEPAARGTRLAADERLHARLLSAIANSSRAGMDGRTIARLEGRHHAIDGNALRAAVLSANDGLASNLSLVMVVAGADLSSHTILITGLAGLLAGACSMAMGEWISVKSSRELFRRQIALEAEEIREAPDEEYDELVLIYQSKGLSAEEAGRLATEVLRDQAKALDTSLVRSWGLTRKNWVDQPGRQRAQHLCCFPLARSSPCCRLPFYLVGKLS